MRPDRYGGQVGSIPKGKSISVQTPLTSHQEEDSSGVLDTAAGTMTWFCSIVVVLSLDVKKKGSLVLPFTIFSFFLSKNEEFCPI